MVAQYSQKCFDRQATKEFGRLRKRNFTGKAESAVNIRVKERRYDTLTYVK
jgi:hypothetical protein